MAINSDALNRFDAFCEKQGTVKINGEEVNLCEYVDRGDEEFDQVWEAFSEWEKKNKTGKASSKSAGTVTFLLTLSEDGGTILRSNAYSFGKGGGRGVQADKIRAKHLRTQGRNPGSYEITVRVPVETMKVLAAHPELLVHDVEMKEDDENEDDSSEGEISFG